MAMTKTCYQLHSAVGLSQFRSLNTERDELHNWSWQKGILKRPARGNLQQRLHALFSSDLTSKRLLVSGVDPVTWCLSAYVIWEKRGRELENACCLIAPKISKNKQSLCQPPVALSTGCSGFVLFCLDCRRCIMSRSFPNDGYGTATWFVAVDKSVVCSANIAH